MHTFVRNARSISHAYRPEDSPVDSGRRSLGRHDLVRWNSRPSWLCTVEDHDDCEIQIQDDVQICLVLHFCVSCRMRCGHRLQRRGEARRLTAKIGASSTLASLQIHKYCAPAQIDRPTFPGDKVACAMGYANASQEPTAGLIGEAARCRSFTVYRMYWRQQNAAGSTLANLWNHRVE